MRNKLSFVLILLMFSSVFNSFADETPYMNLNSKKPIKKIKVKSIYDLGGENKKFKNTYYFSRDKKRIERQSKGKFIDYFYSLSNSNNVEEFINNLYGRYKKKTKKTYKNGLLIHAKHFYDKKLEAETDYKYDSLNRLIEEYNLKTDSSYCKRINYEYKNDKLYREITTTFYNDHSNLPEMLRFIREPRKITKEYDDRGNIISLKRYSSNDSLDYEIIYNYLDTLLIEETSIHSDGRKYREVIKYNEYGKILEKINYQSDTITSFESNKYDENRNLLEYNYNIRDIVYNKDVYEYNKDNIIQSIKGEYNYKDGDTYSKNILVVKFDIKGNEIERCFYNNDGKIYYKYVMKYNKRNLLIETIESSETHPQTNKYTYKYSFWD